MSALVRFLGEKYTIGQIVFFTLRVTASPSLRLLFAHSTWSFRQNGSGYMHLGLCGTTHHR
jgi:hypothetical protein